MTLPLDLPAFVRIGDADPSMAIVANRAYAREARAARLNRIANDLVADRITFAQAMSRAQSVK
jgi:hypothetical protein